MKRSIVFMLVWPLILASSAFAQEQEITLKPTPPPVSSLDFFKGTRQLTVTGIYMKLGAAEKSGMDESPAGAGINIDISRGYSDGFGALFHITGLGLNVPLKDPLTDVKKHYPAFSMGFGGLAVLDLVKGEKRDIAGEIVAKKPTLAVFAGFDGIATLFKMGNFMDSGHDLSVETYDYGLPVGLVADIPFGFYISLVPFGRYTWSQTTVRTTVPSIHPLYNPPYYMWMAGIPRKSVDNTTRADYGFDIDLRLFRNAPEWKISVGTMLSQVSGLKDGNVVVMVSVKREWGKHYSSTLFGPKLY